MAPAAPAAAAPSASAGPGGAGDKIQEYFASMNSLSARISSDIRAVEENITAGEEKPKLTYNEKCAAIDKYLIDDVVEKNTNIRLGIGAHLVKYSKLNRKTNASATNHLWSLILAVQPPKPEKYMFEETGGVWLDEHSGPFSFCKQSQVKHCALGKNVLQNLAEAEPADVVRRHHFGKTHEKKKQKSDMKNKAPPGPGTNESKRNSQEVPELIQPHRPAAGRGIFGVNVMDFGTSSGTANGQVKSTKLTAHQPQENKRDDAEEEELQREMEDKLPQQKQNLQLIAELQAKLKRSNPVEESNTKIPEASAAEHKSPAEIPQVSKVSTGKPQVTVKNSTSTEEKKGKTKSKVKKPKAPPPPPPPRATPKLESSPSSSLPRDSREDHEEKSSSSSLGRHQKAMAEQLRNVIAGVKSLTNVHSRKKSNPSPTTSTHVPVPGRQPSGTATIKTATELPGPSKVPTKVNIPRPPIPRSRSQSKEDVKDGGSKKSDAKGVHVKATRAEGGPEFCVDVSSPCKIATPKTGLDFLDNW